MNRYGYILGFSLLVIAATLAASITMRNAPGNKRQGIQSATGKPLVSRDHPGPPPAPANAKGLVSNNAADRPAGGLCVTLEESRLAGLPANQQAAWRARAAAVESDAKARLERLSAELELTAPQRDKLFPALVRSAAGFDPVMLVGGARLAADPS